MGRLASHDTSPFRKRIGDARDHLASRAMTFLMPHTFNQASRIFCIWHKWSACPIEPDIGRWLTSLRTQRKTLLYKFTRQECGPFKKRRHVRFVSGRPVRLRTDLIAEAAEIHAAYEKTLTKVQDSRLGQPPWACEGDELDRRPEEAEEAYVERVKKLQHQKW